MQESALAPLAPGLAGCALAALLYALFVQHTWPDAGLLCPLLAVFFAAAIASVAGFAFAPICAAMLVHVIDDPVRMVAIILVASVTMQALCVVRLWREMDWRGGRSFLVGGLTTLPFGLLLLQGLSGRGHTLLLGVVTAAYAVWMLWRPATLWRPARQRAPDHVRQRTPDHARQRTPHHARQRAPDVLIGAMGGITGGLAGFPAAPVVAWCGLRGLGRVALRGLVQPYILVMQGAALLMLHLMLTNGGAMPRQDLLLAIAPALLGTLCGLQLYGRLSDRQFRRAVNLMLLVSGLAMLA